jgi:hypothetical protein
VAYERRANQAPVPAAATNTGSSTQRNIHPPGPAAFPAEGCAPSITGMSTMPPTGQLEVQGVGFGPDPLLTIVQLPVVRLAEHVPLDE